MTITYEYAKKKYELYNNASALHKGIRDFYERVIFNEVKERADELQSYINEEQILVGDFPTLQKVQEGFNYNNFEQYLDFLDLMNDFTYFVDKKSFRSETTGIMIFIKNYVHEMYGQFQSEAKNSLEKFKADLDEYYSDYGLDNYYTPQEEFWNMAMCDVLILVMRQLDNKRFSASKLLERYYQPYYTDARYKIQVKREMIRVQKRAEDDMADIPNISMNVNRESFDTLVSKKYYANEHLPLQEVHDYIDSLALNSSIALRTTSLHMGNNEELSDDITAMFQRLRRAQGQKLIVSMILSK